MIGKIPSLALLRKNGITEPLEPITFPYLTTENFKSLFPFMLFAAIKSLSDTSLVAPYKLIGAHALSVLSAITFFTPDSKQASITFCPPIILVLTASNGLYSHDGTCYNAAA